MSCDPNRVEEIFNEIIALPEGMRETALNKASGNNQALRREVESLLAHDASTGSFLSGSVLDARIVIPNASDFVGEPKDGLIGAYRLIRRIGSGGMGSVYLAARADGQFDQQVAIKVVKRGMDSEEILRRFQQERRMLATLNHPHIARLYDGGATADGRPYIVMEFVDGLPIDQYCNAKKLSIARRLRLFIVVCDAVRFAHQNLVVHRDIKPSNIMVDRHDSPKLLDFGLSKVLGDPESDDPTISRHRRLTPAYASPEQITGQTLSTATDIYSLGVVLYELLTCRRPYRMATGSPAEFERAVFEQTPLPPSMAIRRDVGAERKRSHRATTLASCTELPEGTVERLARLLRGDLDTIVLKALHKDPARRYESVEQLSSDIERHLKGLPVFARPDNAVYRLGKFVRRHIAAVALGALTLLAMTIGLALAMWQRQVAQHERALAQVQEQIARRERDSAYVARDQAEATADFFQRMMSAADPVNEGPKTTVKDVIDAAALRLDAELSKQPRVEAAIRSTIGRIYLGLGLYPQAEQHIRAAYQARRKMLNPGHHDIAESEFDLARLLYEQGNYDGAETLLLRSLDIHQQLRGKGNVDTARVWNDLGAVRRAAGKIDEAEAALSQALQIRESTCGRRSLDVAETLNNLSGVMAARGDFARAEDLLKEALEIRREILREEHPLVIQSIANVAVIAARRGDYDRAARLFRDTIAIERRIFGDQHPTLATDLSSLASVLLTANQASAAEPLLREALSIRRLRFPPEDVRVLKTQSVLARSLMALGKCDEGAIMGMDALSKRDPSRQKSDGFWLDLVERIEAHYRSIGQISLADGMRDRAADLRK